MKNILSISKLFLVLIAFAVTSCDVEPLDPAINLDDFDNSNNGPALFKADFSGSTWTATSVEALVSGNFIAISGLKANGEGFDFLVQANAIGTYPANTNLLTFTPSGSEFGYWSTNFNNPEENTGSITITNINTTNNTISGTFNFKGYWSDTSVTSILPVQFTNGVFQNIPFITQDQTGDSFFAKVGGTEFVDVDILTTTISVGSQEFISIGAQNAALNSMTISVKSSLGTGTYAITGNATTDGVQAIYDFNDVNYTAATGSITIISKTATRIRGNFNFVTSGATPFTITEGAFDVEY
ncbi:DUF6252 family protein [Flavobacterium sp. j3]|uniref:DUF6252 family protein n=1 Tax=Flavobacterium aureirubrum TaxID=3133147 RepID=A0ABU9NA83_9FLAO